MLHFLAGKQDIVVYFAYIIIT